MRVEVIREFGEDDGLNRRVWRFVLRSDRHGMTVNVDEYREESRPTTRHKWRLQRGNGSTLVNPLDGRQMRDPYTVSDGVAKEALGAFIEQLAIAMRKTQALAGSLGKEVA